MVAMLACMATLCATAQEVYNEIYRISSKVADSTSLNIESRKIATFKVDALKYMAMRAAEQMPDSSAYMLDKQAYAMYDFIDYYLTRLSAAGKDKQREAVKAVFKDASINNSRYNDMDKDLVLSYYDNDNFITQFSLDTDWEKADKVVHDYPW